MQKRLMFVAILLLAICNRIVAEDQITIGDFSLYSGDTKAVSVMLTNEDSYVGFQFDLYLPDGISVESFSANSSRIPEGTTPQMSQQSDGSYRFVAAALERNPIVGNEGAILTLTIKAADSIVAKDYTGYLRNIKISKTDGTGVTKAEQTFTITVKGAEAYAVLTGDTISGMTLTFYYDTKKEQRGGMNVGPFSDYSDYEANSGWYAQCGSITSAVFDPSFANCTTITSTAWWFDYCTKLTSITGLNYLNTANVTDMKAMFRYCMNLTNLDVSGFKTDNVTDMSGMFSRCQSLTSLDVSGFKTDKVTDMSYMFEECLNLTNLDVSGFKTDNVTNMGWMFDKCRSLTSLDVTGFNTQNVTDMSNMFHNCFGLTSLDLSNFNTQNVTNMHYMFRCTNLTSLDVSHFNTQNVTDMSYMFIDCRSLTSLDVTNFNTKNVTDMSYMISGCSSLTSLDLSNFNTQNVAGMSNMFQNCSSLTTIYAGSEWSTTAVTKSTDMFNGCTNLVGGQGTAYDSLHVDVTYAHIDGGPDNPGYLTPKNGYVAEPVFTWSGDELTMTTETEGATIYYSQIQSATFNFNSMVDEPCSTNTDNDGDITVDRSLTAGGVTLTISPSTRPFPNRFWSTANGPQLRVYGGMLTFSSMSNVIKKIVFNNGRWNDDNSADVGSFESNVWTGESQKVEVSIAGNTQINSIEVYLAAASTQYTAPVTVTSNVIIEAYAEKEGMGRSTTIVLDYPYTAWMKLITAIADAQNVLVSADGNENVTDEQRDALISQISVAQSSYMSRTDTLARINQLTTDLINLTESIRQLVNAVNEPYTVLSDNNTVLTFYYDNKKVSRGGTSIVGGGTLSNPFNVAAAVAKCKEVGETASKDSYYIKGIADADYTVDSYMNVTIDLVDREGSSEKFKVFRVKDKDGKGIKEGYQITKGDVVVVYGPVYNYKGNTPETATGAYLVSVNGRTPEVEDGNEGGDDNPTPSGNTMIKSVTDSVVTFTSTIVTGSDEITVDFNNQGWENGAEVTTLMLTDGTTISFDKGDGVTTPKYYTATNGIRLYAKNIMTINGSKPIAKVVMNCDVYSGTYYVGNDSLYANEEGNVVTIRNDHTVSSGGTQLRVKTMVITFKGEKSDDGTNGAPKKRSAIVANDEETITTVVFDESFANCTTLTSTSSWFSGFSNLTTITGIKNLKTDNVTDMNSMFYRCSHLTSLDLSNFNTAKVESMGFMFWDCSGLTSLDLSNFNTQNVTYMYNMFFSCSNLATIYVGEGWSTANVESSDEMFTGCSNLVGGAGTTYDYNHVDATYAHIDGGSSNPGYFTRSGDAPYVAPELYAVLEENASANSMVDAAPNRAATAKTYTMKFYYDGKKTERNGMSVETYREATTREWDNMAESITNVVFDLTVVNDTAITSTGYWFSGFTQLTSIEGLNYLNTSHVADTWAMFEKCSSLKEVNLSNFDTRNVKTMGLMFYGCENLLNLDVSSFNTANVTHTNSMFANCIGLTSLDLSGFNTRKVENMSEMFLNCTHLTTIYAGSDWSTESSAGGGKMFGSCYSLVGGMGTTYDENHVDGTYAHIDGGPDNPGYLTDIADLGKEREPYAALSSDGLVVTFYYDRKKEDRGGVDINTRFLNTHEATDVSPYGSATTAVFDASFADYKPTSTAYWFCKCSSLKTIRGIENLNTVDVTDMSSMFYSCDSLTSIDVSGFNTENVTNMNSMFGLCYSLARLDVSNFNTENVTNMGVMFSNCHELTSLDLSNFKTDNVTDMSHMFSGSWNLTSVNLSGFNTKNVKDMSFMFYGCFDLQSLDISHFNTANVTNMRTMFYGCGISSLDLSGFNTAKVTEMSAMFSSCRSLKTIFAGDGWSTAKVEDGIDMFMECTSLVGGMGTAYDSLHIDYTYAHIDGGPDNPGYFTDINGPSQKVATPSLAWTDDMLTISTTTEDATIRYTISDIGNGRDTLTYSAPIEVKRDVLIRTWAEHMGMFASDTITLDYPYTAWQQLREAIEYSMITVAMCQGSPKVKQEDVVRLQYMAENANAYYSHRELQRDEIERMVGELMVLSAMLRSQLEAVEYVYDSTNGVLTISGGTTVAEALEAAGGSSAASALTSIIWQNTTPLTNDDLQGLDNPNMLIYVADASLAPANRDNVIIGNDSTGYTAMNIVLADVADGNGDFYCPIAFTAEMISYTHEYRQQTEVGVARGWETIAMPFTVQTITHEKNGVISPFGNDASTKHFWLRQLTQQGLAQARQIEANTPYLISMPNSDAYPVEFNQAGRVTFSSQNATVPVTQLNVMEAPTATGGMVMIQPNFKGQSATSMIYALNVGVPRGDHPEGSVFEANYRSVRPFEAFTVHHGDGPAPQFISIVDINNGGTTGIGDVRSLMSDGRGDNWYDLNGRRLQQKPTRKGVYILNGQKVVIK